MSKKSLKIKDLDFGAKLTSNIISKLLISDIFKISVGNAKKEDALAAFPRYLFNEKDIFLKIYKQLDKKKIIKIYKNIMKVELLLRKNSGLYFIIGLRFLLNTKKIIIS